MKDSANSRKKELRKKAIKSIKEKRAEKKLKREQKRMQDLLFR